MLQILTSRVPHSVFFSLIGLAVLATTGLVAYHNQQFDRYIRQQSERSAQTEISLIKKPTPSPSQEPVATPTPVVTPTPLPSPTASPTPKPSSPSPSPKTTPAPTPSAAIVASPTTSTRTSNYEQKSVSTDKGTFTVLLMTLDLTKPGATLITDTANPYDCANDCPVKSLSQFVADTGGFAGLNGTYFCPTAYADCVGKTNSFYFKIWNSLAGRMINEKNGLGEFLPFLVVDSNNQARFFRQWVEYRSSGISLKAGISSRPLLTYNGQYALDESALEGKENTRSNRSMIGLKGQTIYAGVVKNATVPESAAVTTALGLDGAINLDAGGSTGMIYPGAVNFSGRLLPNAIIFKE